MGKYFSFVLIIFMVALIFRFFAVLEMETTLQGDAESYNILARSIIDRAEFSYEPGKPTSWRMPLYPLFLALLYVLGGYNYIWVGILQAILGSLTCIFIYWIGRDVFNRNAGFIAGLISACYLYFVVSVKFLITETLFIFLFTSSVYYLIRGTRLGSVTNMAISGFLLGLASITKSITFLFPGFIFVSILLRNQDWSQKVKMVQKLFIPLVLAFLVPVSIWTVRNYIVHKAFIPTTTNGGMNFFIANTPDEGGKYRVRGISTEEFLRIKAPESAVEANRFFFKKALDYMGKHPKSVAKLMIVKLAFFWSPFDWCFFGPRGVYNYSYGFIIPFSLLGMFLSIKKWRECVFIYMPVLYFAAMVLVFHSEPRYRMPAEPFLIIFSGYGIPFLFHRYLKKGIPIFIMTSLFAVNLLGYLYSDHIRLWAKGMFQQLGLW
jgi:4-amino-4-deoxy-L-arabinose transferase-like glycosyltransferase